MRPSASPDGAPGSRSQSSSSTSKVPHHVASEPGRASAIAQLLDSVGRCARRMRRSRAFALWHRARRPASTDVSSRDSRSAFRPQAPGCSTRTKRSAGAAVANSASPRRSAAGAQRSGAEAMRRCYGRDGGCGRLREPTVRPRRGRGAAARGPRPARAAPGSASTRHGSPSSRTIERVGLRRRPPRASRRGGGGRSGRPCPRDEPRSPGLRWTRVLGVESLGRRRLLERRDRRRLRRRREARGEPGCDRLRVDGPEAGDEQRRSSPRGPRRARRADVRSIPTGSASPEARARPRPPRGAPRRAPVA